MFRRQLKSVTAMRAPKKKKGGVVEAPTNKDLINIWKDRQDPLIYPSDVYPPYVMDLVKEKYHPDDIMLQMYRGENIPTPSE